jgi:hypothetical protein
MKRIQLRTIPDDRFSSGTPEYETNRLDWAEVIRQIIRRPLNPQQGADIEEMRKGIRVLDALEAADQVLELEDADWEHLKQKTEAMQWAFVDRRIVTFVEDIHAAQEQVMLNVQLEEAVRGNGPIPRRTRTRVS